MKTGVLNAENQQRCPLRAPDTQAWHQAISTYTHPSFFPLADVVGSPHPKHQEWKVIRGEADVMLEASGPW